MKQVYFCLLAFLCFSVVARSQFTPVAATVPSNDGSNCFRLTPADYYQRGALWNNLPVNLNQSFEVNARLYFGTFDDGADGIAFVLQREGTSYIGNDGAGIGYHRFNGENPWMPVDVPGPVPSFIVEFDTYHNDDIYGQDIGDPAGDHVGFMSNSNAYHTSSTALKAPEEFAGNLEDGQWHEVQFTWNHLTKTMTVRFRLNATTVQQFTYTGDIVNTIFGGQSQVFWGFTGSTGSFSPNEQKVCIMLPPPPPPTVNCGQLRTQTQGGWGQKCNNPNAGNPGCYLARNFAAAFPNGVRIGDPAGNSLRFLTVASVQNFLPSGGPSKVLSQLGINGTQIYTSGDMGRSNINGQLLTLSISVGFDDWDPAFGAATIHLGEMLIHAGPYAGMTVRAFLNYANSVIGGTSGVSAQQLASVVAQVHATATAINENYVDGTKDNGYLRCPLTMVTRNREVTEESFVPKAEALALEGARLYPNPARNTVELRLGTAVRGTAQVTVLTPDGRVLQQRMMQVVDGLKGQRLDVSGLKAGVYMVRIASGSNVQTLKLVVN